MKRRYAIVFAAALGCSSSSPSEVAPDAGGQGSAVDADSGPVASDASDAGDVRASAARAAAAAAPCSGLSAFYWEIGDAHGPLVSGTVGGSVDANTVMPIASASKFVFGAYVVERFKDDLSKIDADAMRMMSGYTSLTYDSCVLSKSVSACLMAGNNGTLTQADVGRFFYNGGHFQKYAVDLGLGDDDSAALAAAIKSVLGPELPITYGSPQLAGGIKTSAAGYAAFLRKILSGGLAIRDHLGEAAVCTQPATCPTGVYSPAPAAWHYSYAHWIEDDPSGDGAFSSAGAFGFYPWIDKTKTYYGIVARDSLASMAYVESAECGIAIRKAFLSAH